MLPEVHLCYPVQANELFVKLPNAVIEGLYAEGFQFYRWESEDSSTIRLVTAFSTPPEAVAAFLEATKRQVEKIVPAAIAGA